MDKKNELKLIDVLKTLDSAPEVNTEKVTAVGIVYVNENTGLANILIAGMGKEEFFDTCDSLRASFDFKKTKPINFVGIARVSNPQDQSNINHPDSGNPKTGDDDERSK